MRYSLLFLLLLGSLSQGQEDNAARTLVEKAIQARGGEENLQKLKITLEKTRGQMYVGEEAIPFTGESTVHFPDRFRLTIKVQIKGQDFSQTRALNGDSAWTIDPKGQVQELGAKDLEEFRQDLFHDDLLRLTPLLRNKDLKLTLLPETQIQGKTAWGLKISALTRRDLELYFDKETHLLLKMTRQGYDADAQKLVLQEQLYSDHKTIEGVRYPMKWTSYQEGKKSMEMEVTELRFLDKLPPAFFIKPEK